MVVEDSTRWESTQKLFRLAPWVVACCAGMIAFSLWYGVLPVLPAIICAALGLSGTKGLLASCQGNKDAAAIYTVICTSGNVPMATYKSGNEDTFIFLVHALGLLACSFGVAFLLLYVFREVFLHYIQTTSQGPNNS